MIYESFSESDTEKIGQELGAKASAGQVYALTGDLGAGKTAFTRGFARGMNIKDHISSPTYTILQEYDGEGISLYHFDVYRIEDPDEMEETGFTDHIYDEGVVIIEWAEIIKELLPEDTVFIKIEKDPKIGPDYRKITAD